MAELYQIEQHATLVIATVDQPQLTHLQMQELTNDLTDRMRHDGAVDFILNFERVNFLSSACIGVLVTFMQETVQHVMGRVVLCGCQSDVAFLFKVTGLDHVFPMYDDVAEATESLQPA